MSDRSSCLKHYTSNKTHVFNHFSLGNVRRIGTMDVVQMKCMTFRHVVSENLFFIC